ncbi:MAG: HAMP domain-containing protein, partial [Candidatus Hydrogenedentota bacterium]
IDRSTFMVKIVGVSVLLMLVLFLSIAMFIIPRQDKYISTLQKNHARTAVRAHQIHHSIQYIARKEGNSFNITYKLPGVTIDPPKLLPNSITCHIRDAQGHIEKNLSPEKMQHLTGADHPDKLGRIWRCDAKEDHKYYLAYHIKGLDGNMYEVGFRYLEYREAINEVSEYLAYLAILIILATVIGLPFFFKVSLVEPLDSLLQGLEEVNRGNLEVELDVQIQDEIGFLTQSFNSMVSSIRTAQAQLKEYAEELEEKVKERTKELAQTLEQVQALKKQQDGDYYLTQLLIAPLGKNAANDDHVSVDFLVKQKKSFKFRKWDAELGGDICISHNIELMGKKYILFLNGDAMGKSMQGAGGALVLGAVFQSIVERTRLSNEIKSRSPERWLKNTYQELQKVFETFDGSMLVSVIIGLVEVDTGLLYWFNAEHPWLILYRDGVAQFLEDDLHLRKLGTKGLPSIFTVKTFRLLEGDIVFGGSDGKDDTATIDEETGERVINEDETKILKVVEKTDCNLQAIFEALQEEEELTDDISMFRIEIKSLPKEEDKLDEKGKEKLKKLRILIRENMLEDALILAGKMIEDGIEQESILKQATKLALKLKHYSEALKFANLYLKYHPEQDDFLFYASYSAKMIGKWQLAADYGERLALRNPLYIKNLINLVDIYLMLKVYGRAQEILEQAKQIEPDNPSIEKLEKKLKSQ